MSDAERTHPPEVLLLRPSSPGAPLRDKLLMAWQCLMVEMGIAFAFDEKEELPTSLPQDLSRTKLILIDSSSWDSHKSGAAARRLSQFSANGGIVFKIDVPESWSVTDESVIRNPLEMIAASAGLTLNQPALRARLQARTFQHLYERRREHFLAQIDRYYKKPFGQTFGETLAFHILRNLEVLSDYDPAFGWSQKLDSLLNYLTQQRDEPVHDLDQVAAMETFVRQSQRGGNSAWLEFARRRLDVVVSSFERIEGIPVLTPGRDKLIWTEVCALLAPSLALLGVATDRKAYVDLSIEIANTVRRLCYDREQRLYYHAGRSGYRTPAIWARGQAWAVTGLVGILRNLPDAHPDRSAIGAYLSETLEGLLQTQDEEGLWHNVMDEPSSRSCVRAACMIVSAYAEARRKHWLIRDERLDPMLRRAWRAIRGRVFGNHVASTCWSTGASYTRQFYLSRPHVYYSVNDVLHCGAAYVQAFGDEL